MAAKLSPSETSPGDMTPAQNDRPPPPSPRTRLQDPGIGSCWDSRSDPRPRPTPPGPVCPPPPLSAQISAHLLRAEVNDQQVPFWYKLHTGDSLRIFLPKKDLKDDKPRAYPRPSRSISRWRALMGRS